MNCVNHCMRSMHAYVSLVRVKITRDTASSNVCLREILRGHVYLSGCKLQSRLLLCSLCMCWIWMRTFIACISCPATFTWARGCGEHICVCSHTLTMLAAWQTGCWKKIWTKLKWSSKFTWQQNISRTKVSLLMCAYVHERVPVLCAYICVHVCVCVCVRVCAHMRATRVSYVYICSQLMLLPLLQSSPCQYGVGQNCGAAILSDMCNPHWRVVQGPSSVPSEDDWHAQDRCDIHE